MSRTLTRRNQQVLDGLWEGKTNEQMARELGIAVRSVQTHITNIGRMMHIDTNRFCLRVRIIYLLARQRRLI